MEGSEQGAFFPDIEELHADDSDSVPLKTSQTRARAPFKIRAPARIRAKAVQS